jgi:hypothetical protein
MLTTGIAFAFILKGKVQQHRQWMTGSLAVALVFLEVRVILGITGWENLGESVGETVVGVCLSFSLFLADVVLQVQELRRTRAVPCGGPNRSAVGARRDCHFLPASIGRLFGFGFGELNDSAAFTNSEYLVRLHLSEALDLLRSRPLDLDDIHGLGLPQAEV